MVSIFKAPKKQNKTKNLKLTIDCLDHEAQGVCRHHKPVVFVPKTLPGEVCNIRVKQSGKNFLRGALIQVLDKNPHRIEPKCDYFEQCGGCQTQYVKAEFMRAEKERALDSLFQKQLSLSDVPWQEALSGEAWQYRRKARLAFDAQNKNDIKLGFRSESDNTVLDIDNCPVLDKTLNALLPELKQLVIKLNGMKYLGHVGLFKAVSGVQVTLRFVKDIDESDRERLKGFADRLNIKLVIERQKSQFETLSTEDRPTYIIPQEEIKLYCEPNDFVQVNDNVNQQMVAQAIDWLSLEPNEELADLFCGIGNFSLALAKYCHKVIGLEGIAAMVQRANDNAKLNAVENVVFDCLDINQSNSLQHALLSDCNVMVLDPSRAGAKAVVEQLSPSKWKKILYVSCHAGTFARDVKIMQSKGFNMMKVSAIDMFPQTSHLELMALFLSEH